MLFFKGALVRIAMISEHASPLGLGGQQTHVADLSIALAELGHDVRVYTRRDSPDLPAVVPMGERVQRRARAGGPGPGGAVRPAAAVHGRVRALAG